MAATRVSDTQVTLNWSQSSASNGQPTTNTIQESVNGGAYADLVTISATTTATVVSSPNRKTSYRVRGNNAAGSSGWSAVSNNIFTTPAAPTSAVAAKGTSLDIIVSFTPNVTYSEHEHEVWHGVIAGGVTTWDGSVLATLPAGTASYTHVAPNASKVHVYRVRAKAGELFSSYAETNSVQLLVAPNTPTVPAMPAFADKASALVFNWVHNSIDTTPQKSYEFSYSTNGGTTWTSTGKVNSAVPSRNIAASTYAANVALTMRVRTWGSATAGGSYGTGASPWADLTTVTFKTIPVATVVAPANGSTINDATLRVTLGFAQAEAATFVKAQLELLQGATLLETLDSVILVGIAMATPVQNGVSYTVRGRVQDSNGIWSAWATSTFSVTYLSPPPAGVTLTFLQDNGYGQIDLLIPAPGAGQSAATKVTITRTIKGEVETIVKDYPASPEMTFLDTTATVHGTNTYTITTKSALGAQMVVVQDLITSECRRAYLSKGAGYSLVGVFGGNLSVKESLSVASDTVEVAGRTKPIGLYGVETVVQLKVDSFVYEPFGSTLDELRVLLLVPGKACYRDSSGRRVFGTVKGGISYKKSDRGTLSFTMNETS